MPLLLDTTILSAQLKRPEVTFTRFITHGGQLRTSQIVLAELYSWAFAATKGPNRNNRLSSIDKLRLQVVVLPFDDDCSKVFGELRVRVGTAVGAIDLMIAATAILHEAVLVSHDHDFVHLQHLVPELRVIDWL